MREQTVAIYCLLDDLLRVVQPTGPRQADPRRRLTDAQVLTTALLAARYFGGNLVVAQRCLEQHWGMKSLDKSGFCRHLHRLADTLWALFAAFGTLLKQLSTQSY